MFLPIDVTSLLQGVLKYQRTSPLLSGESKEGGAKWLSITVSKGKSLCVPNRVDLWFGRTKRQCFGQGNWRASTNLANWVLMSLVPLTKPEEWGWSVLWKCCKTSQTVQTCGSNWPVKWRPQSFWSLKGVPWIGIIFSKRILAAEEAVTCLQGKVSVQCANLPTVT